MHPVLERIGLMGIIPVIAVEHADHAIPLAAALIEGGLPCAEVTFRTDVAAEAIALIAKQHPAMLLGAGTVLTVDQARLAVDSGAQYIVSPGLNRGVVEYCLAHSIPVTPGVATPTEIEAALEMGLKVVKFFPAEASGGIQYLKAMSAPYRGVLFIPTGGIDSSNLLGYLRFPRTLACGGSWMVRPEMISSGQFDEICRLTSEAVQTMLGFDLKHVGINCDSPVSSVSHARTFADIFMLPVREGTASTFAGSQVEFTKKKFPGASGHIAIGTNFIHRAIDALSRKGVGILPDTQAEKNGKLVAVYLDREIAGFAIHLLQV